MDGLKQPLIMMPTLDAALLYSSRAGSDLGLRRDLIHHSRVTLLMKKTLYHQARLDIGCTCLSQKKRQNITTIGASQQIIVAGTLRVLWIHQNFGEVSKIQLYLTGGNFIYNDNLMFLSSTENDNSTTQKKAPKIP